MVKNNPRKAELLLVKIQRLMCQGVTGAMSACPTARMEVVPGLLLLHLQVRKFPAQCRIKLHLVKQFKLEEMTGNLRFLNNFQDEPVIKAPSIMLVGFNFERQRRECTYDELILEPVSLRCYTDRSKIAQVL